jgi:hypothetical protein
LLVAWILTVSSVLRVTHRAEQLAATAERSGASDEERQA